MHGFNGWAIPNCRSLGTHFGIRLFLLFRTHTHTQTHTHARTHTHTHTVSLTLPLLLSLPVYIYLSEGVGEAGGSWGLLMTNMPCQRQGAMGFYEKEVCWVKEPDEEDELPGDELEGADLADDQGVPLGTGFFPPLSTAS